MWRAPRKGTAFQRWDSWHLKRDTTKATWQRNLADSPALPGQLFNEEDCLISADRSFAQLSTRPAIRQRIVAQAMLRPLSEKLNENFEKHRSRKRAKKSYSPDGVVVFLNFVFEGVSRPTLVAQQRQLRRHQVGASVLSDDRQLRPWPDQNGNGNRHMIKDGTCCMQAMRRERITEADALSAIRRSGRWQ